MNCLARSGSSNLVFDQQSARFTKTTRDTVVLIVEDHTDTRGFIHKQLQTDGFKVLSAASRDSAARLIETINVDVILLDYFMAGMSAFQFITMVRDRNPNIRIILMTAAGYAQSAGRMLGVSEFIEKPVTGEHLHGLLLN